MKERPILFSAPMVRALLDGSKSQTRRAVKLRNGQYMPPSERADVNGWRQMLRACPYGQPGDRLWVRESHAFTDLGDGTPVVAYRADASQIAIGRATPKDDDFLIPSFSFSEAVAVDRWRPSIHMPRWASRITLEITCVRVERLVDISEADAKAEGVPELENPMLDCRDGYFDLWVSINGLGSWEANPWVWVIKFRRVES